MLPIVDVVQAKKPSHLRFAKDLKEDHAQGSSSEFVLFKRRKKTVERHASNAIV